MPKFGWDDIPEEDREPLCYWYNRSPLDVGDRARLTALYRNGKFAHWYCPECGDDIYVGHPDDWRHFQGVLQSEHLGRLCGTCAGLYQRLKEYAEA